MPDSSQRPFRGLFDMFAELNRMREHWTEVEPTQSRPRLPPGFQPRTSSPAETTS